MSEERNLKRLFISNEKRRECLQLFIKGHGYKSAARISGLNKYTVREYLRRYKAGDISWADKGPGKLFP